MPETMTVTHIPSQSLETRLYRLSKEIRALRSDEHSDCECDLCRVQHAINAYLLVQS